MAKKIKEKVSPKANTKAVNKDVLEEKKDNIGQVISVTYYTGIMEDENLLPRLEKAGVDVRKEIPDTASALFWNFILALKMTNLNLFRFQKV